MKIKKTIWTVITSDYNVNDNYRHYVCSDVYVDEHEAWSRYHEAKKYLINMAGFPEPEDGSFPGRKFVVNTSEEQYDPTSSRTMCTVERVTDVPEELYRGEVHLAHEEVEIDLPIQAQLTADGSIKIVIEAEKGTTSAVSSKEESEPIYIPDGKRFVERRVADILNRDGRDENKIKEVLLEDNGNCIHVTFTGCFTKEALEAIGKAFGDNNPDVYSEGDRVQKIVFINDKYIFR